MLDTRAIALLRRHGLQPSEILGVGMEGTVVALSATEVAKVWHGRSRADLDALVQFGAALGDADLEFDAPVVLDLLEDGDVLITIERRVHGSPLRVDGLPEPPVADADAIRLIGDALADIAQVQASPGLAALQILPGDEPFDQHTSFTESLADLVDRRFRASPGLLRREVRGVDHLVTALTHALRELDTPEATGLVHGDLIPANVLIQDGRVSGMLDFGFLTTIGDPQFDAAITASIFDMYGPHARESEELLSDAFLARFGHDPRRYGVYRAAYAVITNACFGSDAADGHFAWCANMLRRPDVRSAVLG